MQDKNPRPQSSLLSLKYMLFPTYKIHVMDHVFLKTKIEIGEGA